MIGAALWGLRRNRRKLKPHRSEHRLGLVDGAARHVWHRASKRGGDRRARHRGLVGRWVSADDLCVSGTDWEDALRRRNGVAATACCAVARLLPTRSGTSVDGRAASRMSRRA